MSFNGKATYDGGATLPEIAQDIADIAGLISPHETPLLDATGNLVGMLSQKDCLKAALHASYYREWGDTVADYMSSKPVSLDADLDLVEAAEAFLASSYRRFPVMSEGRLVGQISRSDLLRALAGNWQ